MTARVFTKALNMRYGFQMDFHTWLDLIDAAIAYIEQLERDKKSLEAKLTTKDEILQQQNELVTSLKQQIDLASTAMFADAGELEQMQHKFNRLSDLLNKNNSVDKPS